MDMMILLALAIGGAFGVALDRVGATNPNLIVSMLSLRGLHLMKTILLAIGVGSILMFGGQMLGLVEVGHMSVKAAYSGVFIGGLLLGAGWAASGYCPGTGLAAMASGRRDAAFFVIGGLLGAAAYMLSYEWVQSTGALESIAGGKATLGEVPGAGYSALVPGAPGDLIGVGLGAAFILIAFALPDRLRSAGAAVPAE